MSLIIMQTYSVGLLELIYLPAKNPTTEHVALFLALAGAVSSALFLRF